jgi:hypothetical protein
MRGGLNILQKKNIKKTLLEVEQNGIESQTNNQNNL